MEKDWEKIRQLAGEYAVENIGSGMNCCESVYEACIRSGALDVSPDTVANATGFGGGGGAAGLTCGALSAAILANGAVYGRKNPGAAPIDKTQLRARIYRRYNNIVKDFVKVNGSGLCRELLDQYEGYFDPERAKACRRICGAAAQIAVDYLQKGEEETKELEYDPDTVGIKGFLPV